MKLSSAIIKLALSVLEPFRESSLYEDYQEEDGWTDKEYNEMVHQLQIHFAYSYVMETVGPEFYQKLDALDIDAAKKVLEKTRMYYKTSPSINPIFGQWETEIGNAEALLQSSFDFEE